MNKIFRNGLLMLAVGAFVASCADYNELDGYKADPDPTYTDEYADLDPVKSYINKADYPQFSMDTYMDLKTYNKQGLDHAVAKTNFDGVAFGYSFMPGSVVNKKGYMNFLAYKDALSHASEIDMPLYGSPIVANEKQPDDWFGTLTAPVEIRVLPENDLDLDYSTIDEFTGTVVKGSAVIVKNYDDKGNALKTSKRSKVYIVEGFDVDPLGFYTITFMVKSEIDKDETINCTFADSLVNTGKDKDGKLIAKNFVVRSGGWNTVKVEWVPAKTATQGYLMIEGNLNTVLYIRNVHVEHTPDNHEPQTAKMMNDTSQYALNKWCDELMEANAGRIKSFDLVDKPLDSKALLDGVTYEGENVLDLKHATDKIFWQDYLNVFAEDGETIVKTGSELYAATVSKVAREAFEKHGGDPAALKFFIAETGLENPQRLASLKYWIKTWEKNMDGKKIDGINAELNLTYVEDADNETAVNNFFKSLADYANADGKLIRISNFDIKYKDAEGNSVTAEKITKEQRKKLADYYAFVINAYLTKIPADKQAGLCKGNMFDTSSGIGDPVGLWSKSGSDWVRNATYKGFCDGLSGKKN